MFLTFQLKIKTIKLFSNIIRNEVISLCRTLFKNNNYAILFDSIMSAYKKAVPKIETRISNIVEIISDLKDEENETVMTAAGESMNIEELRVVPKQSIATLNIKITDLKYTRMTFKNEFDKMYKDTLNVNKSVDMVKLGELRDKLREVDEAITKLIAEKDELENIQLTPALDVEPASSSTKKQKQIDSSFEVDNTFHCLQLTVCLLEDTEIQSLNPQLRELFNSLIITSIGSIHEDIRGLAVRALNLICILNFDIAQNYLIILLGVKKCFCFVEYNCYFFSMKIIQSDKNEVVFEAFKAIINSIMAYSLVKLVGGKDEPEEVRTENTTQVMSILTSLLDHRVSNWVFN